MSGENLEPNGSTRIQKSAVDAGFSELRAAFRDEDGFESFMSELKEIMASFKCPTHDWQHLVRVTHIALSLAESCRKEGHEIAGAILEIGALCHDVCDSKLIVGPKEQKIENLRSMLKKFTVFNEETVDCIVGLVTNIGYKHLIDANRVLPEYLREGGAYRMEYLIVQDADLLDAIGAVGVARCMAFSGKKNRPLVYPLLGPNFHDDFGAEQYAAGAADDGALSHFFEKLFRIPALLQTAAGKAMGEKKNAAMLHFVQDVVEEVGPLSSSDAAYSPFLPKDEAATVADFVKLSQNTNDVRTHYAL